MTKTAAHVRFVHTSDWQLGMERHYLASATDKGAQARFRDDRISTIARIGEVAKQQDCAFVVVAGDVFDNPNHLHTVLPRACREMAALDLPIYLLPGNHDPIGVGSIYLSSEFRRHCPDNVHVITDTDPIEVAPGVQLIGAPWRSKHPVADTVCAALPELEPTEGLRIVVGHGQLDVLNPDATDLTQISTSELGRMLDAGLIHYVALGDRHIGWPPEHDGRIHYSGAHESTSFRELGRGEVLVVDLHGPDSIQVTPKQVGRWQHLVVRAELDGAADIDALDSQFKAIEDPEHTIVKTALSGALSLSDKRRLDEVIDYHDRLLAALFEWTRHTAITSKPTDDELADLQLTPVVAAAMGQLLSEAATADEPTEIDPEADEVAEPTDAQIARDALTLLYQLAGQERT